MRIKCTMLTIYLKVICAGFEILNKHLRLQKCIFSNENDIFNLLVPLSMFMGDSVLRPP